MTISSNRKLGFTLGRAFAFTIGFFLLVGIAGLFSACQKQPDEIKIGVIAPLTGELATYGEREKNVFLLAQEEINQAGGINGAKLTLVIEDSKTTPTGGVSAAQKLISVDKVPVIIGETASSITLAIAPIAEREKVVLLTPISSNDKISQAGDYIFRLAPYDSLQAVIVAKWFIDLGYKTAAIIYINNDYGKGLNDSFIKEFQKFGGQVIASEAVDPGKRDFRSQLTKLKQAASGAIFAPLYPEEAGIMLKQKAELNIMTPIVGTDPFHDPKIFELAGNAADGLMFTDVAPGNGPVWEQMKSQYMTRYKKEPDIVVAESYDAVKLIAHVISKVGTDTAKIRDALYNLQGYVGAIGEINFDRNGDNISKSFYKYKIQGGKYVEIGR